MLDVLISKVENKNSATPSVCLRLCFRSKFMYRNVSSSNYEPNTRDLFFNLYNLELWLHDYHTLLGALLVEYQLLETPLPSCRCSNSMALVS